MKMMAPVALKKSRRVIGVKPAGFVVSSFWQFIKVPHADFSSVLVIPLTLLVRAPTPIVDTESHEENGHTDSPTKQKDEDKFLAASHIYRLLVWNMLTTLNADANTFLRLLRFIVAQMIAAATVSIPASWYYCHPPNGLFVGLNEESE
jgi:hypothetical protein